MDKVVKQKSNFIIYKCMVWYDAENSKERITIPDSLED